MIKNMIEPKTLKGFRDPSTPFGRSGQVFCRKEAYV